MTWKARLAVGSLSLAEFDQHQTQLLFDTHDRFDKTAWQAYRDESPSVHEAIVDVRLYRAQLGALLCRSLYLLEVETGHALIPHVGSSDQPLLERVAALTAELTQSVGRVAITIVGSWPYRGYLLSYLRYRHRPYLRSLASLSDCFAVENGAAILADLEALPIQLLDQYEQDIADGRPARIEAYYTAQQRTTQRATGSARGLSYLERYLNGGEEEAVWAELVALGPAIRREPEYGDALAVARETMRRVRHNLALLVERLAILEYRFYVSEEPPIEPLSPEERAELRSFEANNGPIPLALRAWFEEIGSVYLVGYHPRLSCDDFISPPLSWVPQAPVSDPLSVSFWLETDKAGTYLSLMHRAEVKAGRDVGEEYRIRIPNAAVDAPLEADVVGGYNEYEWAGMYFVDYLRLSLQWGGFAGLSTLPRAAAAAKEELAFLTKDLLPI